MEKEGFSLVEMLISIAITAILLLTLVAVMSYGSRSMQVTQARVALQDQAKDAVNHITTHIQECDSSLMKKIDSTTDYWDIYTWDSHNKALVIRKKDIENKGVSEKKATYTDCWVYWCKDRRIYFANAKDLNSTFDPNGKDAAGKLKTFDTSSLPADRRYLLADNIAAADGFSCTRQKNLADATKDIIKVKIKMQSSLATFECEKDVLMRNE